MFVAHDFRFVLYFKQCCHAQDRRDWMEETLAFYDSSEWDGHIDNSGAIEDTMHQCVKALVAVCPEAGSYLSSIVEPSAVSGASVASQADAKKEILADDETKDDEEEECWPKSAMAMGGSPGSAAMPSGGSPGKSLLPDAKTTHAVKPMNLSAKFEAEGSRLAGAPILG